MELSKIKTIFLSDIDGEKRRMKLLSGAHSLQKGGWSNELDGFSFVKLNNSHISEIIEDFNPPTYSVDAEKVDEFVSFVSGKKLLMVESMSHNKAFLEYNKKFKFKYELIVMSNGNKYVSISC